MTILKRLFSPKKQTETDSDHLAKVRTTPDLEALKAFCALILGEHDEAVFKRCQRLLVDTTDPSGSIDAVLYVLSGQDVDVDDPFGNIAEEDQQLVRAQYYLISSDVGAPCLDDFFWFIEDGIKAARGLDFVIAKEKFSNDDCLIQWLAELARQLNDLYIINFDSGSEDYHFTIMNEADQVKASELFAKMTAHIDGYSYAASLITDDFQG